MIVYAKAMAAIVKAIVPYAKHATLNGAGIRMQIITLAKAATPLESAAHMCSKERLGMSLNAFVIA
jgi:hypothetical protein